MKRPIAIVPARGGSKRLPRKNLLPFRGRPMLAWTVQAAIDSGVFSKVIVSSDDEEMLNAGLSAGADIHRRATGLSGDDIPLKQVAHAMLNELGVAPEAFCLLMPNCPLRDARDVRESYAFFQDVAAEGVMSVVRYGWRPPEWAMRWNKPWVEPLAVPALEHASKSADGLVCPSGALRWARTDAFMEQADFYLRRLAGFELPWHRAIDIDIAEDFEMASCVAHAMDNGFEFRHAGDVVKPAVGGSV